MTPQHEQTVVDMRSVLESAARHIDAYDSGESDSYEHLHRAVTALGRLVSHTEALMGPLAEQLVEQQTDRADRLGDLLGEVDRSYEIGGQP